MGRFSTEFNERKKADKPLYKMPRSVQQTIEILNVYENGIFEVAKNRYSKTYRFTDINYTITSEAEQETIFLSYCKYLNSMDVPYKISVLNLNRDMNQIRTDVFIDESDISQQEFIRANNENVKRGIDQGKQKIAQERFLTITIERKNIEEAKAEFATIEANIHKAFGELGSDIKALNGDERLELQILLWALLLF